MSTAVPSPSGDRPLPDFLKAGDKALGLPRGNRWRAIIGTAIPAHPEPVEGSTHDPAGAPAYAAQAWAARVAAGRIG